MSSKWRISVTVSAIIEKNNKFLMVEEQTRDGILLNQPSGHLEAKESPLEASIRETREETSFEFIPSYFLGVYLCQAMSKKDNHSVTYLRLAFCGNVGKFYNQPLDDGIICTHWLSYEEIIQQKNRLRTPLVLTCINDYMNGQRLNLNSVHAHSSVWDCV
jgi:ADP-ribose pyrophosphatase YjhB (NUDIX family)